MLSATFRQLRLGASIIFLCLLTWSAPAQAEEQQDFLYYRDVLVPPYQSLREFFDMPERPGHYEVNFVSESLGPLTFKVVRVHEELETVIREARSYRIGSHEFRVAFDNTKGVDDLRVEVSNSNPLVVAKISVIIVEVPNTPVTP